MQNANIHEAKTTLSRLVDAAMAGEDVVISKRGKPAVRLVPVDSEKPLRRFGVMRGAIRIADDFDAPLPDDIVAAFEGR
ncbi:type II toxin-antitoxin system Phd/YefM family antitoxin [Paraburkholderia kururiensis]|jgi:prevent-host-death family protein|uniref:type II toxin-antitoxin system Phd/YefM family antitoxin n=1 Tax=Paraburkholderia kururiensis TaxID=984307 RepID=UPI000F88EADD|nr:type II toxin-antitoxin system prevent-host-death family antitoxin [Paraburkholderia kururiensis]